MPRAASWSTCLTARRLWIGQRALRLLLGSRVKFVLQRLELVNLTANMREGLERCLLDAIDETLSLVLSERTKEAIYAHMEKYFDLGREEIPRKPDLLATCLEKIFGRAAPVVEKMILKKLYSKLGIDFEEREDWSFKDYIISVERCAGPFRVVPHLG